MKRILLIFTLLISVGVVASNDQFRHYISNQFRQLVDPLFETGEATQPQFDSFYNEMVEDFPIQQRSEKALELAINRFKGATEYILENAQSWRGEIIATPELDTLINISLNSPLIEVRMAGFELYIAKYDFDKTPEQISKLLKRYAEKPTKSGPWALWSMAVIGARGVDRERIYDILLTATENPDDYIRRWAVDALAKFGGEEIISPLLEIAKFDSSPIVQERAFCGLAQSGTLHVLERYSALPGLLEITRDSYSSSKQLFWSYQALKEISNFYDIEDNPDEWEKRMLDVDMIRY